MSTNRRRFSVEGRKALIRGSQNAAALRSARADALARSMAPVVLALRAEGYVSIADMARALSDRAVAHPNGVWTCMRVQYLYQRLRALELLDPTVPFARRRPTDVPPRRRDGVERTRSALRDDADEFARGMASLVSSLRANGCTTCGELADALNARGVLTRYDRPWTVGSIRHLESRLREMAQRGNS